MKRKVWKWIFGLSLAGFILLVVFTFGVWVLFNVVGALFLTLMGNTEINAIPFADFMSNFVGSPLFYMYLVDIVALLTSVVGLVATKKQKENREGITEAET